MNKAVAYYTQGGTLKDHVSEGFSIRVDVLDYETGWTRIMVMDEQGNLIEESHIRSVLRISRTLVV